MNLLYTINSLLIIVLLVCSYKSKKWSSIFVLAASVNLTCRQIIRLADFEQTKPNNNCESVECTDEELNKLVEWNTLTNQQLVLANLFIMRQQFNFNNQRGNNILIAIEVFLEMIVSRVTFHGSPDWSEYFDLEKGSF